MDDTLDTPAFSSHKGDAPSTHMSRYSHTQMANQSPAICFKRSNGCQLVLLRTALYPGKLLPLSDGWEDLIFESFQQHVWLRGQHLDFILHRMMHGYVTYLSEGDVLHQEGGKEPAFVKRIRWFDPQREDPSAVVAEFCE